MNWQKTILYLIKSSDEDYDIAIYLTQGKKYIQGLFFCHLAVEKLLKACVINETTQLYPYTHTLFTLSNKANIFLNEKQNNFLAVLSKFQMEGRYPDADFPRPDMDTTNEL